MLLSPSAAAFFYLLGPRLDHLGRPDDQWDIGCCFRLCLSWRLVQAKSPDPTGKSSKKTSSPDF